MNYFNHYEKPILCLFFSIISMSTITALSKPIFNLLLIFINKLNQSYPICNNFILNIYKWLIFQILLIYIIYIIIQPITI